MRRPRVLVLLAAFNGSNWIVEQVDSILAQDNVDIELIICDDGSTDDTVEILRRFAGDGSTGARQVNVISPPSPTGSAAQNFLWLMRATPADGYDFISFSDQDDVWHEDKLARGCAALMGSDAEGYSSAVTAFWGNGKRKKLGQERTPTESDFLFEGAGQGCTFLLANALYGRVRQFFIEHEALTGSLRYHDWAIYALTRLWKRRWAFDPVPSLEYRQHLRNDTGARSSIGGVSKRLGRIRNGWYAEQLRIIGNICFAACPGDALVAAWRDLLAQPRGLARTWRLAAFCARGGRRRLFDRLIVLGAVAAGWI